MTRANRFSLGEPSGAILVALVASVLLGACVSFGAHPTTPPERLAFTHVALIDGTGGRLRRDMTVIVLSASRIERIGRSSRLRPPAGARVVNGRGKYLLPGMFETHAHWFTWFGSPDGDTVRAAAKGAGVYLANGVTSLIDVAGYRNREAEHLRVRDSVRATGLPLPRIFLSGRVDSLTISRTRAVDAGELARRLLALDLVGIKIHRGLTPADLRAIVTEARKVGRPVYGHTYELRRTGYHDYTRAAVEAGVDGVFHVMGMAPLPPSREPSLQPGATGDESWLFAATRWLRVDTADADSLIQLMIRNGAWLQPTLVADEMTVDIASYRADPAWRYAPQGQDPELTGFPRFQGEDLARYRAAYTRMKWFVRRFHEAGGSIVAGTDGIRIPGFGLVDELALLVDAGLSPIAALQAATANAARAFGLDAELGTIEEGKLADLVLLDADPLDDIRNVARLSAVVVNGRYLDRAALDALLAAVERPVPR